MGEVILILFILIPLICGYYWVKGFVEFLRDWFR